VAAVFEEEEVAAALLEGGGRFLKSLKGLRQFSEALEGLAAVLKKWRH